MLSLAKHKILNNKIEKKPFPFIFIKNFIDKESLKKLNNILPSFEEIKGKNVLYQSSSRTKKTILPSSSIYKKLLKNRPFNSINLLFKKLQPTIINKFQNEINLYVKKKFTNKEIKYHSSYSVMKKGYVKSPHLDRRDHLIHMIFYPSSESSKGGDVCLNSLKKKKKTFDIFPDKKSLVIDKKYKVYNNSCLIILNVPWAYHSVTKYLGNKDRKYFYLVYDFPILKSGSKIKNRKNGFNQNQFWNNKVKIDSTSRKNFFLSE